MKGRSTDSSLERVLHAEYLEEDRRIEELTAEIAEERFAQASKIEEYRDEVYDVLIKYVQKIEQSKGLAACTELLLPIKQTDRLKKIEYAQTNSILEIVILKARKYKDKWGSKGAEEQRVKSDPTPAPAVAAAPPVHGEGAGESLKPSSSLRLRPGIFTIRKLARMKQELRWKTDKLEKLGEQEHQHENDAGKALEEFFKAATPEVLGVLIDIMESQESEKLFLGDWESIVDPNLQIDFVALFFTFVKEYITYSIIFKREVVGQKRLEKLSEKYYREFVEILASMLIEEIEVELVVCLGLVMSISILLKGAALHDCFSLFSQEGKTIFTEKNILQVQQQALKSLGLLYVKEKNELLVDVVYSFFTSDCLSFFGLQQRKSIVEYAMDALLKSLEPKRLHHLIKKIMYTHESAAQYSECTAQMISIMLSKIRTKEKATALEVNGFFTRLIARSSNKIEHINPYCQFLAVHNIEIPMHHLIRGYDPQFIATFYTTYFRHPFTLEKGTKAVGDFINFVYVSDNLTYIYIINMVPFIPVSPFVLNKLFLIYKRVYANPGVFSRGIDTELLLLRMKTPALVGVTGFIFSDPRPIIKRQTLKTLARAIKVSPNLSEDYIMFLTLMHSIERAKLENYNYKGILAYLKDEVTLKYMGQHIAEIIKMIHEGIEIESKDFYKTYANELLKIATDSTIYPLSLRVIADVLYILFQKDKTISFSEELHVRFRECMDILQTRELSMYNMSDTFRKYIDLYNVILKEVREEVPEVYNYVVLNIVDLGVFFAPPIIQHGRDIKELLTHSNLVMKVIREFPTAATTGVEIWEWIYGVCVKKHAGSSKMACSFAQPGGGQVQAGGDSSKFSLTQEEYNNLLCVINIQWINDLIIIRGDTPGIIENTHNYLQWILNEEYSLETLLALLRVSSRERRKELLKAAVLKGYNINETLSVYAELHRVAKGTWYEHPIASTHNFLCSLTNSKSYLPVKKLKTSELYELNLDELIFLSTEYPTKKVSEVLVKKQIFMCCTFFIDVDKMGVVEALSVIANSENDYEVSKAVHRLEREEARGEGLMAYVPQIVQVLAKPIRRSGKDSKLAIIRCMKPKTAHSLIWEIRAQGSAELEPYERTIMETMSPESRSLYGKVSEFLQNFAEISERLKKHVGLDRDRKKQLINEEIAKAEIPAGSYLPITGETVVGVVKGSGRSLQSAEKVPYMVTFKVKEAQSESVVDRSVIFKFGDDCRQDVLALQVIKLFQKIFEEKGLSIFLYPYKVLATGNGTGIIEVIPKATSRDQIGRERVNNLVDYFSLKYGYKEGHKYMWALKNFVESFAGYSLVTYILNIKDRHNGNIMISDEGHLIHIDFGFMLDISPGNINIESPIKITDEIFSLLGGSEGQAFQMYKDLMIKGFYMLRKRAKDIMLMIDLGRHSGLGCYTNSTMRNLLFRFRLDLKDEQVPEFVENLIFSSTKKLRTWIYDQYQHLTNNIAF
ncbi:phosphatidylinositol 4-kinase A [Nematocida sp. AWRm77]|nr:phosphatidylinositol 4-kinase A [Nematocida sp. AWRm77]